MKDSIFGSLYYYFASLIVGCKSIIRSVFAILPYFFSVSGGENRKEVTEQYPDPISSRTAEDLPSKTRGLLYNEIEKCIGCRDCEVVCPTKCISIETEVTGDNNKTWVSVFDIDMSRCIFCGLCVESCIPNSLVHSKKYEGAVYVTTDLITSFGRGRLSPEHRKKWISRQSSKSVKFDFEGGGF